MPSSNEIVEPADWPEGVIARYVTVAGATVDVTDKGEDSHWRYGAACTGCFHKDDFRVAIDGHRDAQRHAERCRALPRPTA